MIKEISVVIINFFSMLISKIYPNNSVKLNYIIYEFNDTVLLLNCVIHRKNKKYFSNIPIELFQFTQLMLKQNDHQEVLGKISESLFNKNLPINQVAPSTLLDRDLIIDLKDLIFYTNSIRASA